MNTGLSIEEMLSYLECNRRFQAHLQERVESRTASDVLRRLAREGEIHLVKKGRANHEALYKRRKDAR
jgi:hypothetical protein